MDINEKLEKKAKELDSQKKKKAAEVAKSEEASTDVTELQDGMQPINGDDPLVSATENLEKELAGNADMLAKLVTMNEETPTAIRVGTSDEDGDDISSLLDQIEDNRKKEEVGVTEEDDIEAMLEKLESEKVFVIVEPTKEKTGPADYVVTTNNEYVSDVEGILDLNDIKVVKKSATEKNAILDRFSNSGPEVNMALVNSGIFTKMSGFGAGEIIAMNQIKSDKPALVELTRLDHICQHITGSTIGRMKVNRLIKVVSYYDKESLFYAGYAGTYPEESELNRTCEKCRQEFYMKVPTSELLLNGDEFMARAEHIRNDVTTFEQLIATSELGKVHIKKHSSGMVIYYKHPSIENYITILQRLDPSLMSRYGHLVEWAYGIDKITIPDANGNYAAYTDPNEIIIILSKLKSPAEKYEILDMINEVRPTAIPRYGFKETKCPHCGHVNSEQSVPMEQLLFFQASREEEMAALRWTAKEQKKKKQNKKG